MRVFYSGHVQGVGFRYTAKTVAAGFEISGNVRNLSDGRVELIAEGAREELAVTVKVAVAPAIFVKLDGGMTTMGGVSVTVNTALELVTDPRGFVTSTA